MTQEEVIAAIQDHANAIGHVPTFTELHRVTGIIKWTIRKHFGTYGRALAASGFESRGTGHTFVHKTVFRSWAEVVRTLGRIPKILEYETHTKHSSQVVVRRFGGWRNLPLRILEYMRAERLEEEWKDVFEVILTHLDPAKRDDGSDHLPTGVPSSKLKVMRGQPMYGTPLLTSPLSCAPINELGVVFLFGAVAREMGFVVTRLQQEFPDCEALRQVQPGRWQRVSIEFEYESRNFLAHGHNIDDCDLIVCWNHNWTECPLEVIELKKAPCMQVGGMLL